MIEHIRDRYRAAFGSVGKCRYAVGGDGSDYHVSDGRYVICDAAAEGHRHRLLCIGCSKFRGFVGIDLEQHLTGILQRLGGCRPLRPIVLGVRKTKAKP